MAAIAATAFSALSTTTAAAATTATAATAATAAATTATAATAATAAASAASAAGGFSALAGGIQSALSAASAISTVLGGISAIRSSSNNARVAELNADAAILAAREQALRIRQDTVRSMAANRVAFAASGLDVSSGGDIETALISQRDDDLFFARTGGAIRASGGRAQAASIRAQGASAGLSAFVKATGTLKQDRFRTERRG